MRFACVAFAAIAILSSCAGVRPSVVPPPPKAKAVDVKLTRESFTRASEQVDATRTDRWTR